MPAIVKNTGGSPFNDAAIKLFTSSINGSLESGLKNNASLKVDDVKALADQAIGSNVHVTRTYASLTSKFFHTSYKIEASASEAENITLEIYNFTTAMAAQEAMKAKLSFCDSNLDTVAKSSTVPLGQVSVQFGQSLLWVRDALLVQVELDQMALVMAEGNSPDQNVCPSLDRFADRRLTKDWTHFKSQSELLATQFEGHQQIPLISPLIETFATDFDNYLQASAVPAMQQQKPETRVSPKYYKGPVGGTFKVKFNGGSEIDKLRRSESLDPGIASAACSGNATGEYTFRGFRVGKTTLTLIAARSDNMAIGTVQVEVEITDPDPEEAVDTEEDEDFEMV